MNSIERYLQKQSDRRPLVSDHPKAGLSMVITIPCFNEPDIIPTLESLIQCEPIDGSTEVIILINHPTDCSEAIRQANRHTMDAIHIWLKENRSPLTFRPVLMELSDKKAGVGLARKIAMDEAAHRLNQAGNPQGIIIGLDADSLVQTNYLKAIEDHFIHNTFSGAASIHFEHPLTGTAYSEMVYDAITQYELHLRYYIAMQRQMGFPFAYQTIGSGMAVRALTYAGVGGMNRRQAGEDFYFLQKCIKKGGFTEINETTVIPSPRISDRVPFGTGRAVGQITGEPSHIYKTYDPRSFEAIKPFWTDVSGFFERPFRLEASGLMPEVRTFLEGLHAETLIEEIRNNTSNPASFCKRFFQVFDAFTLMKYLHFMRVHKFPDIPVLKACAHFIENDDTMTAQEALKYFRKLHLSENYGK